MHGFGDSAHVLPDILNSRRSFQYDNIHAQITQVFDTVHVAPIVGKDYVRLQRQHLFGRRIFDFVLNFFSLLYKVRAYRIIGQIIDGNQFIFHAQPHYYTITAERQRQHLLRCLLERGYGSMLISYFIASVCGSVFSAAALSAACN